MSSKRPSLITLSQAASLSLSTGHCLVFSLRGLTFSQDSGPCMLPELEGSVTILFLPINNGFPLTCATVIYYSKTRELSWTFFFPLIFFIHFTFQSQPPPSSSPSPRPRSLSLFPAPLLLREYDPLHPCTKPFWHTLSLIRTRHIFFSETIQGTLARVKGSKDRQHSPSQR